MGAVVAVLNESLTEALRGFYKLRKAYITLDGILAAEAAYMKKWRRENSHSSGDGSENSPELGPTKGMPGGFSDDLPRQGGSNPESIRSVNADDPNKLAESLEKVHVHEDHDDDDDEFHDADEDIKPKEKPKTYTGKVELRGRQGSLSNNGFVENESRPVGAELPPPKKLAVRQGLLDHDPDSDVFTNPIDVFIHSGANLCFGLLLVMISLIPPSFWPASLHNRFSWRQRSWDSDALASDQIPQHQWSDGRLDYFGLLQYLYWLRRHCV